MAVAKKIEAKKPNDSNARDIVSDAETPPLLNSFLKKYEYIKAVPIEKAAT